MNLINIAKNIFSHPKEFFLENLGIRQTIFKNTLWLVVAEGVSKFLKLILIIYVARILGTTDYGKFNFAFAFVALFVIFSDFGLSQITTREFAQDKKREKEFLAILSLKIILSLGALFLILISSFFITPDPLIQKLIWILGLMVIVENFSAIIFAFFQARQKMEYQAWSKIFEAVIVTAVGFFVILKFPSVQNLSYAYLSTSLVALIFILLFFHFKIFHLRLSFEKSIWQNFLTMSWPLALVIFFGAIYSQIDSIMMGYFGQITETGWYNAAYKIINMTIIPASLISMSFFPVLSKFFRESKEKLQMAWNYFMESIIFLVIPIVVGGIALAPRIIDFIYGPSYFPSILAFQILLIMAGISFLSFPFRQILIVANQQKKIFWAIFGGAIINVILNLILIPRFSLYGAAATAVFTLFLILLLLFGFTLKLTFIKPFNLNFLFSFIGISVSSAIMYFVISQSPIYHLNILLSVLIGALIYLICFFVYEKIISQFKYKFIKNV